jgi:hypothetical protein
MCQSVWQLTLGSRGVKKERKQQPMSCGQGRNGHVEEGGTRIGPMNGDRLCKIKQGSFGSKDQHEKALEVGAAVLSGSVPT